MSAWMGICRSAAIGIPFILLFSLVWFFDDLDPKTIPFEFLAIFSSLIAAASIKGIVTINKVFKLTSIFFCFMGILSAVFLMIQDYTRSGGQDIELIVVRSILTIALIVIAIDIGNSKMVQN